MTEANGCPGCLRDTVASVPVSPRWARVRARSAYVGSGGVEGLAPAGGPACRLLMPPSYALVAPRARSHLDLGLQLGPPVIEPIDRGLRLGQRGQALAERLVV